MSNPPNERVTKKRRTPGQRERLVRRYHSSGLSQSAYCRQHGLHPATLSSWLRKAPPALPATDFQEVRVSLAARGALEIALGGAVLRIAEEAWLVPVLRALREAGTC